MSEVSVCRLKGFHPHSKEPPLFSVRSLFCNWTRDTTPPDLGQSQPGTTLSERPTPVLVFERPTLILVRKRPFKCWTVPLRIWTLSLCCPLRCANTWFWRTQRSACWTSGDRQEAPWWGNWTVYVSVCFTVFINWLVFANKTLLAAEFSDHIYDFIKVFFCLLKLPDFLQMKEVVDEV